MVAALTVLALVATGCLYYPAAGRSLQADAQQPWWCDGPGTLTDTECLHLSAGIDVIVANATRYPTVADALAAGAVPESLAVPSIGAAYRLPTAEDVFSQTKPQLLLYAGTDPADRLAGVAHLIERSVSAPPPAGY
ncbi:MAG: hypothetical protein HKN26_14220, partial [Acidimicrobiales bacterium]|nr:hypothetical protein [Acidimicrobiales bacterium]